MVNGVNGEWSMVNPFKADSVEIVNREMIIGKTGNL
jgi:hypothetical protein